MKANYYILGLITILLLLSSCGKDYLNTSPTNAISPDDTYATTDNLMAAVQGIHKAMYLPYNGRQSCGGESAIKIFADKLGDDSPSVGSNGWFNTVLSWSETTSRTSDLSFFPWYYYYKIIANANLIIENVDAAEGPDNDKKMIKAQALAYRAYSHYMICQFYGPRYTSANIATLVAPLMTESTLNAQPKSSLGTIMAKAKEDIATAVTLFTESGYKRTHKSNIDLNVANGIKARIALYMGEYATAASSAVAARSGYPLMSNSDYQTGGFNSIGNVEWIWASEIRQDQTLYFYAFHAFLGYNAGSSFVRGMPMTISKELYRKIPATDIRKGMFVNPGEGNERVGLVPSDSTAKYRARYGIPSTHDVAYYANLKFSVTYSPGGGDLNHIRSAEMYLIEAEANARSGNDADAQTALFNVVSPRDPSYVKSTSTGDTLIEEIMLYRRIELWHEGFRWFDLKRTGSAMVRNSNTNNIGNFTAAYTFTVQPNDSRWAIAIPQQEINSNPNINN